MNTTTRYNLLVLKKMDPRYIIQISLCCSLSCSIVCMVRGLRAGATPDVSCMHDGSFTVLKTVNLEHRMVLLGCATVNVYMSVRDTRQGGTRGRGVLTFPRDVHASQLPDLVSENECFRRHHVPRSTVSDGTRWSMCVWSVECLQWWLPLRVLGQPWPRTRPLPVLHP